MLPDVLLSKENINILNLLITLASFLVDEKLSMKNILYLKNQEISKSIAR